MAFDVERLHGIVPPVVTPLTDDEHLDEAALRRLLNHLLEGGVHGLYMLGTTGEFPALTTDVKVRAIEVTREEVGTRVPVLAGAGETSTVRAIRLAALLEQAGADVVFSTPPYYFLYSQAELLDYYRELAGSVDVPVFLYNIPQMTKVAVDPETVRTLAADPRVVGIKDSSGNFANYLQHIETARLNPDFHVLIGSEVLAGASVIMGGNGIVASTANVAPQRWVQLYEAACEGDVQRVAELQEQLRSLTRITSFGGPAGCKAALEVLGVTSRKVAAPDRSLTDDQVAEVRGVLAQVGMVD